MYILPFYVCYAGVLSAPVPFPLSHGCNFPQIDPATLLSRAWLSTNKPGFLFFFPSSPFIYSLHLFCLIGAQHDANSNRLPSVKGRIRGEFKRSREKNRKMHSYPCGGFVFCFFLIQWWAPCFRQLFIYFQPGLNNASCAPRDLKPDT